MRLSEKEIRRLKEITREEYNFNEKGETEDWENIVYDLIYEFDALEEEYFDYKEKMENRDDYDI